MPRAPRWLAREVVAGEGNASKKRKKVAKEAVQKEGVEVANSGIEEERVEVAPTEPAAAATVEVAVEKSGNVAAEAPSGIEGERVEVAPTKPSAAATMELAEADEVLVEKAGDAAEAPSGIKEERMVEVVVAKEVALAPSLMAAVLTQETELTQEQILQQRIQEWVVVGHARQHSLPLLPPKTSKVMKELEVVPKLIVRDMDGR
jgi:hypothetical protein